MVTLKDIAKQCNVSIATVSRILNDDLSFKIKKETRRLIIDTAYEMGYEKSSAKDLQSLNVALVQWISQYDEQEDPYYNGISDSVEKTCYLHDIILSKFYIENLDEMSRNKNIDAILCIGKFSDKQINYFSKITSNIIFIDSNPKEAQFSSVLYDLEFGTESVINYLLDMGHNFIGYIGGREFVGNERQLHNDARESKFIKMWQDNQFKSEESFIYKKRFDYNTGKEAIEYFSKLSKEKPTAFVCANDLVAMGALDTLNKLGVEKVSIISFNNLRESQSTTPPLTTLELDTHYIATIAISQLINSHMLSQFGAVKTLIKPKLIIRDSVYRNNFY